MRVAIVTLGCKVNQYEGEVLAESFLARGWERVAFDQEAEVYVVNSCTVTGEGSRKSRKLLSQARRRAPGAVTVLTGCYPQAFPQEAAALEEADVVTGARERGRLWEAVEEYRRTGKRVVRLSPHPTGEPFEPMAAQGFLGHTRAFVKIEDGCDQYCAYCVIPRARGPVRSKPLEQLMEEAERLARAGYREIVLSGINLSKYGRDLGCTLWEAVESLCALPKIRRVRLGSLEPNLLPREGIRRMAAAGKVCPQFHLALQSGCDATLARMGRRYTLAEYEEVAGWLREAFPGAALTTDVMVGFPGETEEEFAATLAFVRKMAFARVHVFPYSRRAGTRAAEMPGQLPGGEKRARAARLAGLGEELRRSFWERQTGTTQLVLVEGKRAPDGRQQGQTGTGIQVRIDRASPARGMLLPVRILAAGEDWLEGTVLEGEIPMEKG